MTIPTKPTRGRPKTGRKNITTTLKPEDADRLVKAFGMPVSGVLRVIAETLAVEPTPEKAAMAVQAMLMAKQLKAK